MKKKYKINNEIKAKKIYLIDEFNKPIGLLNFKKALYIAKKKNLDLIEISNNLKGSIIVKMINYKKFIYKKKKKYEKNKKKNLSLKKISLKLNIAIHDYKFKINNIFIFLKKGHKVKIILNFKGREKKYINENLIFINKLKKDIKKIFPNTKIFIKNKKNNFEIFCSLNKKISNEKKNKK
ncbi:translation initiation factor IF-3 [Candidatus Zinderia insecticola CARI]|uniref:Translation initiation factor IF-3 n=1 Tax=Zinderia insecticola (strain CARI) TaxID=871271 RepID=E0TIN1_ZINIC|nr:translation initiation factor IF-3 [Candidatus Zinderia insecticola CARI]